MSTRCFGRASRNAMVGTRLCPPASTRPSSSPYSREQVQRFGDGLGGVVLERGGLHAARSIGRPRALQRRSPERASGLACAKRAGRPTICSRRWRQCLRVRTTCCHSTAMPQTIGQPLRRKEDLRLAHRRRPLQRRRQPARPGLCLCAALAARPCPHPRDRHRGGARHAGRAGGADRRGRQGRRAQATCRTRRSRSKPPADILLTNRDGSAHGYAPQELLPTDRVRYVGQQVVDGGGGEHRRRQGRRRARRGGLRAARAGDRRRRRGADRRAAALRPRRQCLHRCRRRRRRGDQGGVRARHACGEARHLGAARHRRAARRARRGRRLRSGDATNTRCTPAPAAWCGRSTSLPPSSACRRPTCASNAATSAAISARATPSIRSSRWWCGRRSASAAR